MQLKNSTNDKSFRRIKNSQEERERRGRRDGANFAGNAENQNTNLLHIWHKQHTHSHSHTLGSGAKSSKTPLGLASRGAVAAKWGTDDS